jgi:sulfite dehydrogenase (cytochrome) subunit A
LLSGLATQVKQTLRSGSEIAPIGCEFAHTMARFDKSGLEGREGAAVAGNENLSRRKLFRVAAQLAPGLLAAGKGMGSDLLPRGWSSDTRRMVRFPEKREMILLTDRAPQLETPLHYFRQDLTPNDAFFVRWHLAGIPTRVDTNLFQLQIDGHVQRRLSFSLGDLRRRFEPVSVIAIAQCSGNSRSLFVPRVPGGQWKHGAMGNALWTGVRLRDLLDAAGIRAGAVDVSFDGLDEPPLASIPDVVKSLAVDHARQPEVLVAYEMNGAPLPMLNGFPIRLVVPGWYATYWIKALSRIVVLDRTFDGFWMAKAYRVPNNPSGDESPDHLATDTIPIHRFTVRSIFVRPEPEEQIVIARPYEVEGVAFDYGTGIRRVEVSIDNGVSWQDARLDPEIGRYSFRRWRYRWTPQARGDRRLMVRATNNDGVGQPARHWNRSGFMRQIIEDVAVRTV